MRSHIPQQMASKHLANADCAARTLCLRDNTLINGGIEWVALAKQSVPCTLCCAVTGSSSLQYKKAACSCRLAVSSHTVDTHNQERVDNRVLTTASHRISTTGY